MNRREVFVSPNIRLVGILLAVLVMTGVCLAYSDVELIDDAYISFRYAVNLINGHGLVFNPGQRVEGYTNFLWVLLLAGVHWLGSDLELAGRVLGVLFAILTVLATAWLAEVAGEKRSPFVTLFAPFLLALNPAFGMWAVHGLETAMFAFFLTVALAADLGWYSGKKDVWLSSTGYLLAALTRPEGALFFFVSYVHRLISEPRRALNREGLARILFFAIPLGLHFGWRRVYYGDWLPNTYYVKVGGTWATVERGLEYIGTFFLSSGGLLFLALLPVAWTALARRRLNLRFLLWMAAAAFGFMAVEGGDAFPAHRFIMPLLPLLYVLVVTGVLECLRSLGAAGGLQSGLMSAAGPTSEPGSANTAERKSVPEPTREPGSTNTEERKSVPAPTSELRSTNTAERKSVPEPTREPGSTNTEERKSVPESTTVPGSARQTVSTRRLVVGVSVAMLAVGAIVLHGMQMTRDAHREVVGSNMFTGNLKLAGETLAKAFPPDTSVALNPVGAVSYITGFRVYDMLGLTDKAIAHTPVVDEGSGQSGHEHGNGRYILDQRPDLILVGNVHVLDKRPVQLSFPPLHRSEEEILAAPETMELYGAQILPLSDGRIVAFLRRRDWRP